MQNMLYCILLAIATNIDILGVRIAYSINGIIIPIKATVWISFLTFIISYIFTFIGSLCIAISEKVMSITAALILMGIGSWMILDCFREKKEMKNSKDTNPIKIYEHCEAADIDNSKHIDFKESTLLAIALSFNNIGGCIGGGLAQLNIFFLSFLSAVFCFISLLLGNFLSDFLGKYNLGKKAIIVSGALVIFMGIRQLFI